MSQNSGSAGEARSGTSVGAEFPRDQLFTQFYEVTDFQEILSCFNRLCEEIGVDPSQHETLYSSLKRELTSWKCRALWELLDSRALLPEYENQKACEGKRVLVVGAGPVGLRAAIEAALLGAKVELVEKRPSFSRNNSLHLWPFLITDLRNLGAKKFYGKFASGTIDHICEYTVEYSVGGVGSSLECAWHRGRSHVMNSALWFMSIFDKPATNLIHIKVVTECCHNSLTLALPPVNSSP